MFEIFLIYHGRWLSTNLSVGGSHDGNFMGDRKIKFLENHFRMEFFIENFPNIVTDSDGRSFVKMCPGYRVHYIAIFHSYILLTNLIHHGKKN
jgi:hypothetical protein